MIYLYSMEGCPGCEAAKEHLTKNGIPFEERDAQALLAGKKIDQIDVDAMAELVMNGNSVPVFLNEKGLVIANLANLAATL